MWIYEKYNTWIEVYYHQYDEMFQYIITQKKAHGTYITDNEQFNTPTKAYTEAITYVLNKLI